MIHTDPRIDAYLDRSPAFARPVLSHLRKLIHQACPTVEETIKWNMPAFVHHGILCTMAAFQRHAAFNLWKHKLILGQERPTEGMGSFGRLTSLQDLPADGVLLGYLRQAVKLNEAGTRAAPAPRRELVVPDDFAAALARKPAARVNFEGLSYSHQREYVDWVAGAKREATRQKRVGEALVRLAAGPPSQ